MKLKRIISLLLTLVMLLSVFPVSVYAEGEEPAAETAAEEAEETNESATPEEADESAEEAAEPAQDEEDPAEQAEEPAEQAEEPAEQAEEPAEQAEEPAEQAEEPEEEEEELEAGLDNLPETQAPDGATTIAGDNDVALVSDTYYFEDITKAINYAGTDYEIFIIKDAVYTFSAVGTLSVKLSASSTGKLTATSDTSLNIAVEEAAGVLDEVKGITTFTCVEAAAKVDTTPYATFEKAFAAANVAGETHTITLLKDCTTTATSTQVENSTITLDLNGKTLTGPEAAIAFKISGTLTITDSTATNNGGIISGFALADDDKGSVIYVNSSGNVTVEHGILKSNSGASAVHLYSSSKKTAAFNMSDGVVYGKIYNGAPNYATVSITGGWFSEASAYIKDGTAPYTASGYVSSGKCENAPDPSAPYTVLAEGGTYTVTYILDGGTAPEAATFTNGAAATLATVSCNDNQRFQGWHLKSGETGEGLTGDVYFSSDVTLYGTVETSSAYVASIGTDNYYFFDGEKGAFTAANVADKTSTITLLQNCATEATCEQVQGSNITIDLNGKTLTGPAAAVVLKSQGTLTIIDGSNEKTGRIEGGSGLADNVNGTVVYSSSYGNVTIEAGTFKSNSGANAIYAYGSGAKSASTLKITGGTVYGLIAKSKSNSTIAISGGTFYAEPNADFIADGYKVVAGDSVWTVVEKEVASVTDANGTTTYKSFALALAAANVAGSTTLTINEDVALTENVTLAGNLTIDLNGNTLDAGSFKFIVGDGCTLTIIDSGLQGSITGASAIEYTGTGTASDAITLNGGTYGFDPSPYVNTDTGYEVKTIEGDPTTYKVVFYVAKLSDTEKYETFAEAFTAANVDDKTSTITLLQNCATEATCEQVQGSNITIDLNGKTLTGPAAAVVLKSHGTLKITDGTTEKNGRIESGSGLADKDNGSVVYSSTYGTVTIEAGTFKSNSGANAIYAYGAGTKSASTLTITGGTVYGLVDKSSKNSTVTITGGSFSVVPASNCLNDIKATLYTGGMYTLYATFLDALNAANDANGESTIKLLGATSTTSKGFTIEAGKTITIDLNGKTIKATADVKLFKVSGTLIVEDNSGTSGKMLAYESANQYGSVIYLNPTGNATVSNATITGNDNRTALHVYKNDSGVHGKLTINSGTITGKLGHTEKGDGESETDYITVNGGWFDESVSNYAATDYKGVQVTDAAMSATPYTVTSTFDGYIRYNVNGGVEDAAYKPADQENLSYLEGYTVSHNSRTLAPVRPGYVFKGWKDADDNAYESGAAFEFTTAKHAYTLTAQWEAAKEEDLKVEINGQKCATVSEALLLVTQSTDVIKLTSDVTENITVPAGKEVTIDLNGHKITGAGTGSAITVKEADSSDPENVKAAAKLTIIDGANGGSVYGEAQSNGGAIDNKGILIIKGGSFSGFAPSYGAAIYNRNTLTIEGGTFSCVAAVDGRPDETGAQQTVYSMGSAVSVTIKGGTFTGSVSKASSNTTTEIAISGGTFSEDPSQYVNQNLCDITTTSDPVTYTVTEYPAAAKIGDVEYKSADAALAAAKSGEEVTCLADAAVTAEIKSGVTLDLNKNKLSGTFTNNGEVIVYDSDSLAVAIANGGQIASGADLGYSGEVSGTTVIYADITFTADSTIKAGANLTVYGKITVNEDVTVTVIGQLTGIEFLGSGKITLNKDGCICTTESFPDGMISAEKYYKTVTEDNYKMTAELDPPSPNPTESEAVLDLNGGKTHQFHYADDEAWDSLLQWETSDDKVATVKNGLVTAEGVGEAKITVNGNELFTVIVVNSSNPASPDHAVSNAILTVGETYQFNYCDSDTNWNKVLKWTTSEAKVATVEDGLVTAVSAGTAYITVEGETFRVDVVNSNIKGSVESVALESNKAVVELYKTDYTRLELYVKLNSGAASLGVNTKLYDTPANTGVAIEKVRLADAKTGAVISDTKDLPFDLVVVDDRYVEFAIKSKIANDVYNKNAKIKGSYKYKLIVTIDGKDFTTDALTISIKKTAPKVKASAVNICTVGAAGDYGYITFTGAEVEAVTSYSGISWVKSVKYDSDLGAAVVTLKDNSFKAGTKGSGTMTIQCQVKGFALTCAAKVKVTVINKAPTVTVKATGTIENKLDQSKVVLTPTIKNGTPNDYSYIIYSGSGKTRTSCDQTRFVCQWSGTGVLTITQNTSNKPKAGTYEVVLSYSFKGIDKPVEAKAVKITVKNTAADKIKLKPVQSTKTVTMFKNDKYDTAEVGITLDGQVISGLKKGNIKLDDKSSLFDFTYNEKTGVISVKWKDGANTSGLKLNSSKTVKFSIYIDGNGTTKANATISLKITIK